jgi:type IV pilus assembly protein PilF
VGFYARLITVSALLLALGLQFGCASRVGRSADEGETTGGLGQLRGPSPADVYTNLAVEYLRERNYSEALKNGKKAVIVDPGNSDAHTILALVFENLSEKELAEKHYREALSLDARNPYTLNAYGAFLCTDRRFKEADQQFLAAVENPLYETPWVALTNAGICADDAGDPALGERRLRRALQSNRRFAPALLRMAQISLADGNYLSARGYLQRYTEQAQHTAQSLWIGIQTEQQLGDSAQAAVYERLLKSKFPDSEQAHYMKE